MDVVAHAQERAARRRRRSGGAMTMATLLLAIAVLQVGATGVAAAGQGDDAQPPAPGSIEGRPSPAQTSPLQALIDRAQAGDRIDVPAGTYRGDIILDKPVTLAGSGRPVLLGSGDGSVVRVRAPGVTIEGFDIDGGRGGDLGRDTAGIHVAAARVTIRDCRVRDALFGIYLRQSDDALVERTTITGIPDRPPGEVGSGIHVWNSQRFTLTGNQIVGTRDGMYIQSSSNGVVRGNRARDLRYGLHYMFSDDNLFEDNSFETGAAGTALMYSKRITFRRNRFLRNRGFASVGLLFKACDEVLAEDNLIADNARGIFLEGSYRNTFRRNIVAMSDMALVIYDSSGGNVFEGNAFVGNLSPLSLVGRRTDTRFAGNYWSDHGEPDLDGDGIAERPYQLSNVFDHLRGNLTAADLFAQGLAARALGVAERAFPVLDAVPVVDERPLARMPRLVDVPPVALEPIPAGRSGAALVWPAVMVMGGASVLLAGGRSPRGARRRPRGGAA